ncbi:MAG TPA: YbaB/EbfC family nucleoid-associated protein [Planktothrix sp.]|jgi:hypothetical protein
MQQPDLQKMMREMQKAQQALEKLQSELAQTPVQGTSGGGAVTITCTGALEFTAVKIKPEAVDPSEVETLEDLILTAIKDASDKAKALGEQKMGKSLGGLQLPGF